VYAKTKINEKEAGVGPFKKMRYKSKIPSVAEAGSLVLVGFKWS